MPPGRYQIIAGTDADNDLFICDPGEACGAWLTTDRPLVLEPDADLSDIDFPIEYLVSLPSATAEGFRVDLQRQREDEVAKER